MIFVTPHYLREDTSPTSMIGYTQSCYICNPGLLYADEVIVQSEVVKELWCGIWEHFVEEEGVAPERNAAQNEESTEAFSMYLNLREKITCEGSPVVAYWETLRRDSGEYGKVPEIDGNESGKVLLFYVSGSVLYEHGETMLRKLRETLAILSRHTDRTDAIWCLDPYADEILSEYAPRVYEEYKEIVADITGKSDSIKVLDEYDVEKLARNSDAIYGDGGTLMNRCRELGRAVLLETPSVSVNEERHLPAENEFAGGVTDVFRAQTLVEGGFYSESTVVPEGDYSLGDLLNWVE